MQTKKKKTKSKRAKVRDEITFVCKIAAASQAANSNFFSLFVLFSHRTDNEKKKNQSQLLYHHNLKEKNIQIKTKSGINYNLIKSRFYHFSRYR